MLRARCLERSMFCPHPKQLNSEFTVHFLQEFQFPVVLQE